MRGFVLITGAMALASCSSEQRSANSGTANINAAAAAAQGDIDTYAANTMEVATPAAATIPKAVPVLSPVAQVAERSEPAAPPGAAHGEQATMLAGSDAVEHPCATKVVEPVAGRTRLSARPDDAEFERPDREATAQRPAAGVWRNGDKQGVRSGREAEDQPAVAACITN